MPKFIEMGLMVFIGLPASLFIGVVVGKGIQRLLPSKSDAPVPLCAMIAFIAACIFIFGDSPPTYTADQDQWYRP